MMPVSQRRRDTQQLISLIAASDPLGDRSVAGWSQTSEAVVMFRRITAGELSGGVMATPGAPPRRWGKRPAVLAVALLIAAAGVAAATQLLGGPAPSQVKQDLAGVDQGMPSDLRYNANVKDARLVAQADGASLYYASLADGGYCSELATQASGPAGAICVPGGSLDREPIHVTVPFVDPVTTRSPFVIGGRVNVGGATAIHAVFADGSAQSITFGDNDFFVFAVCTDHLTEAHLEGMKLVATDVDGTEIASVDIPATDFTNPAKQDAKQPIFVSTISTDDDLTKVLGVEGSINIHGAVTLELAYPDGTVVQIPLATDGRYRYDLPEKRTGDLFESPGWLIARDASGSELARTPVAAVAYWRSHP
jgi:hypothetical protein